MAHTIIVALIIFALYDLSKQDDLSPTLEQIRQTCLQRADGRKFTTELDATVLGTHIVCKYDDGSETRFRDINDEYFVYKTRVDMELPEDIGLRASMFLNAYHLGICQDHSMGRVYSIKLEGTAEGAVLTCKYFRRDESVRIDEFSMKKPRVEIPEDFVLTEEQMKRCAEFDGIGNLDFIADLDLSYPVPHAQCIYFDRYEGIKSMIGIMIKDPPEYKLPGLPKVITDVTEEHLSMCRDELGDREDFTAEVIYPGGFPELHCSYFDLVKESEKRTADEPSVDDMLRVCGQYAHGRRFVTELDKTEPGPHVVCRYDDETQIRFRNGDGIPCIFRFKLDVELISETTGRAARTRKCFDICNAHATGRRFDVTLDITDSGTYMICKYREVEKEVNESVNKSKEECSNSKENCKFEDKTIYRSSCNNNGCSRIDL